MKTTALLTLAALLGAAGQALAQQTAYAIGAGGGTLVTFQTNNPAAASTVGGFTLNGVPAFLDAIDFRPATGQLYGYLDSTDTYFTVNTATGALTPAGSGAGAPTNTFFLGIDFNPTIDRLRVVTDSAQNIVFNPVAGTAAPFTPLAYAIGDTNENANPMIIDNAYTRNLSGATVSQQYAIDYGLNALVTLANNTGVLATVGPLGVDATEFTGFDIFSTANTDTAYALFTPTGGVAGLYTINLATGQATLVGNLGVNNQVYSLAVVPSPGAAAAGLFGTGLIALRRRR